MYSADRAAGIADLEDPQNHIEKSCCGRGILKILCRQQLFFEIRIQIRLVFNGKCQLCLKQIPVNGELEPAALKPGQVFGNGKAQSASLGGTGRIAPDEALGQLVGTDV